MKRLMLIRILVCFGLVLLFTGHSYAQEATPYLIGFMSELTGRQSNLGIANKRGLMIAIDNINAAGGINGRQLKTIFYDGESETVKGVIHTKRLIEVDKVIALTGYSSSGTTLAAIQTVEESKTPLISGTAAYKVWIPTKKWVYNVVARQQEGSIPILVESLMQRGAKKIAYLYIDTAYGQIGKETFDWAVKELKITPGIVEKYAPGSTDMTPQITHIKGSGADGLIITGNVPDTAAVVKNAKDLDFKYPIFSDYAIVSPEFIELVGKLGEGIVTTTPKTLVAYDLPNTDIQKKVCVDLLNKYTKLYGPYSIYASHGWDQAYLLAEALKKTDPKLDPAKESDLLKIREQIRENLEKIKGFVGQNGVFNYSPDNHNGLGPKCYVPVVLEKGKWVLYRPAR